MKNQECQERPKKINGVLYYPFSIRVSKCSGSFINISDPYFKRCIPDAIRDMNLKEFNIATWTNQTEKESS